MKIALRADIHANFSALQTITADIDAWGADLVIVGGDLVNRGPKPRECLEFVHQRILAGSWYWLRGNHEDYVLEQARSQMAPDDPAYEVHRASRWTLEQLTSPIRLDNRRNGAHRHDDHRHDDQHSSSPTLQPANLDLVKSMPFQLNLLDPDSWQVNFVHASMKGIRDGIYPETADGVLHSKIYNPLPSDSHELVKWIGARSNQAPLSLFGVGHTHRPVIRQLEQVLVVNAGSAGLPFDQDTRPSYARLTYHKNQWHAEIRRCAYDFEQAKEDFYTSGYLEGGGPLVKLVLIELQTAQSQLYHWAKRYQERALQGEIGMFDSVVNYLELSM